MIDTAQLGFVEVALYGFVPTFICALLLRAKGIIGILAILGIVGVVAVLLSDFAGWRLGVAAGGAVLGLAIGGKISDARERKKMMQVKEMEQKKRDARLKGL